MSKKKILITGGSGYIGSCLSFALSKKYKIFTIDISKKNIFLKKKSIIHIRGDLYDKKFVKKILNEIKPEIIIHLAGQSTIDLTDKLRKKYLRNNLGVTKNIINCLKEIKKTTVKKFIFSSTAAVYKDSLFKLKENNPINSNNIYGQSKIKSELYIVNNLKKISINYCILRFFNVAGSLKKGRVGEFHSPETHLIPILINSLLKSKKFFIYGNDYKTLDGTCIRDYIHIEDLIKGIQNSILFLNTNKEGIFNLGSKNGTSVKQIITEAIKILKINNPKILIKQKRKYDKNKLICNINSAKKKLKWFPTNSSIRKIIKDEIWWNFFLKRNNKIRKFIY